MNPKDETLTIYGRHPVYEALSANKVLKIFLAKGIQGDVIDQILQKAKKSHIPIVWIDRDRLEKMASGSHQGVAAHIESILFWDYHDVLEQAKENGEKNIRLVYLDGITDPQNLGSIIRSAYFFGVQGIVIPKWRAATVTASVVRASAGAAALMPIAQVSNLANSIRIAKDQGFWLIGADMDGSPVNKLDLPQPLALVLGSEGEGLHRLVKELCDFQAAIPKPAGRDGVQSLNVGVACGILLSQLAG